MHSTKYLFAVSCLVASTLAYAATPLKVNMTDMISGKSVGTVTIKELSSGGLEFIPHLHGLTPGDHGFHVHVNGSCADAGAAAGGHYDPAATHSHQGPEGHGHLGDLPFLVVPDSGKVTTPVVAPRLTLADVKGHSLMIHEGGDNYSDSPENGGGGARMQCGVIPQ